MENKLIGYTTECPLRIDLAGGWLDVPKYSIERAYIVNCTFTPGVSLNNWPYKFGGGLGGSAAKAILDGINPIKSELNNGVGWQDPAVILERGLCVWRSGHMPLLEMKRNPDFITDDIYLHWTGKQHVTVDLASVPRVYENIENVSLISFMAVETKNVNLLWKSVNLSYKLQLEEGMNELPHFGETCKKYCGSGHGGYAFYVNPQIIDPEMIKIELCI